MRVPLACLSGVVLVALLPLSLRADDDEKLLAGAGYNAVEKDLLEFFRSRTLTDAARKKIETLIGRLASTEFEEREKATEALIKKGTPAIPFLKRAADDADLEVR